MNILAALMFVLLVILLLCAAIGIASLMAPENWTNSPNLFKHLLYSSGPVMFLMAAICLMIYLLLSIILVLAVLF